MLTLTFNVKADRPANPHRIASFTQGESRLEPGEIAFSERHPIVMTGENLADVSDVKIFTYPNGYDHDPDPVMVLDELEDITATETTLSVLNRCNSTPEPDGAYWGILARIVATWPDGQTASIDAVFHDDSE